MLFAKRPLKGVGEGKRARTRLAIGRLESGGDCLMPVGRRRFSRESKPSGCSTYGDKEVCWMRRGEARMERKGDGEQVHKKGRGTN